MRQHEGGLKGEIVEMAAFQKVAVELLIAISKL